MFLWVWGHFLCLNPAAVLQRDLTPLTTELTADLIALPMA
ncbi:hypothetical protein HHE02_04340 [Helicobacter heilmannii]|nr:hypothetical protein HHE014_13800 [Helicobacter heilmannii]CRF47147.1 hypothetical protein HHE02_04340 [Helicobacter heilmannii]CRF49547.1 hypothetical protein HHE03_11710 [Helicobacter heilmannii]CRF50755.1 hypothetical protein HHE06_06000 [Helicobacter heilmannii]